VQQLEDIHALNPLEGNTCKVAFLFSEAVPTPAFQDTDFLFR